MPKLWELLDEAYECIGDSRYDDAQSILRIALSVDPQNVDAWNAYIQICETAGELEQLRQYIHNVWKKHVRGNDYLFATQRFVLQRLDEKLNSL